MRPSDLAGFVFRSNARNTVSAPNVPTSSQLRLPLAIETHPDLVGIGIDQDTGFVGYGDGKTRVIGTGTVTILRAVSHETDPIAIEATHLPRDQITPAR